MKLKNIFLSLIWLKYNDWCWDLELCFTCLTSYYGNIYITSFQLLNPPLHSEERCDQIKVVAMTVLLQKEGRDKLCFFRAPTILPLAGSLSEQGKRPSLDFWSSTLLYLVSVNRVHRPWDIVQGELGLPDGNNWLDSNQLSSWLNKYFTAGQQGWPTLPRM